VKLDYGNHVNRQMWLRDSHYPRSYELLLGKPKL